MLLPASAVLAALSLANPQAKSSQYGAGLCDAVVLVPSKIAHTCVCRRAQAARYANLVGAMMSPVRAKDQWTRRCHATAAFDWLKPSVSQLPLLCKHLWVEQAANGAEEGQSGSSMAFGAGFDVLSGWHLAIETRCRMVIILP
ncbi:uncharacterized protein P884DRAFT_288573 [Thermothelomyces heterothallicus CBS 202.75]|uniref:uncharacterized protein n=1 Tax=Thermothelomyces heterothallicus CBS 202.75 TaxID=1149848 RepID=UPI0037420DC6